MYNPNLDEVDINPDLAGTMVSATSYDFFSLFLSDNVINLLVKQTNIYAEQCLLKPNITNNFIYPL